MATNIVVPVVPGLNYSSSLSFGVGGWDLGMFPNPATDAGAALNDYTPYNTGGAQTWGIGQNWPDGNTPPTLPIYFATKMWDSGTNSPDGQLPASVTITNVGVQVGLQTGNGGNRLFKILIRQGLTNYFTDDINNFGVVNYAVNPITSAAWTRADIFSCYFGVYIETSGAGNQYITPNGHTQYYANGGVPNFQVSSDELLDVELVVTYSPAAPTEVDIVGSGGAQVGGAAATGVGTVGNGGIQSSGNARIIAIGSGTPPELNGSQWGLSQFVIKQRLEERL